MQLSSGCISPRAARIRSNSLSDIKFLGLIRGVLRATARGNLRRLALKCRRCLWRMLPFFEQRTERLKCERAQKNVPGGQSMERAGRLKPRLASGINVA